MSRAGAYRRGEQAGRAAELADRAQRDAVGADHIRLLLRLEEASLKFASAAHEATSLSRETPISELGVSYARWTAADAEWRKAVEACRKFHARRARSGT